MLYAGEAGVELVEEPHPLLRQRQRDPLGPLAARTSGGRAPPTRACARRPAASAATVGASNSSRTADSVSSAAPSRATSLGGDQRVAAEVEEVVVDADPRRRRAHRRTRPATISSTGVAAAPGTRRAGELRRGQRLPVELAVRRSAGARRAPRSRPAPCTRAAGSRRRWRAASLDVAPRAGVGHHVGDQPLSPACRSSRTITAAWPTSRMRGQRGVDLAELDPEAADFTWKSVRPSVLQLAVLGPAHQVAGAVHPRPPGPPNGSRRTAPRSAGPRRGSRGPAQRPQSTARPPHPTGTGRSRASSTYDPRCRRSGAPIGDVLTGRQSAVGAWWLRWSVVSVGP